MTFETFLLHLPLQTSQQHQNADGRINDIASSKRAFILKKKDSYYRYKVLLIVGNYTFDEKEKLLYTTKSLNQRN